MLNRRRKVGKRVLFYLVNFLNFFCFVKKLRFFFFSENVVCANRDELEEKSTKRSERKREIGREETEFDFSKCKIV